MLLYILTFLKSAKKYFIILLFRDTNKCDKIFSYIHPWHTYLINHQTVELQKEIIFDNEVYVSIKH